MTEQPLDAGPTARAQWVSVVVTLALSAALAVGLPRLADGSVPTDTELVAGERIEASGVSIEPPDGWVLTGGTDLLVLAKDDSKIVVFPPAEDPRTPEAAVTDAESIFTDDKSLQASIGDITSFSTGSGLTGATATVAEHDAITVLAAFSDGTRLSSASLSTSSASYAALQAEIDDMLATVSFSDGSES